MSNIIKRLRISGVTIVEYAVLITFIAIALISAIFLLENNVRQVYDRVVKSVMRP